MLVLHLTKDFFCKNFFPGFVLRICTSVGRTSDPWSCNAVGCYKTEERNPKFYSGSLSGGEIRESESGSYGDFVGKKIPTCNFPIRKYAVKI